MSGEFRYITVEYFWHETAGSKYMTICSKMPVKVIMTNIVQWLFFWKSINRSTTYEN